MSERPQEPRLYLALQLPHGETIDTEPISHEALIRPPGFDLAELNDMSRALQQRNDCASATIRLCIAPDEHNPIRSFGNNRIVIDMQKRSLTADGTRLPITPKGLLLLDTLTIQPDTYIPYSILQTAVYGDTFERSLGLRVLMSKIRSLLGEVDPLLKRAISVERYFGYAALRTIR